jgi:hypothetical protein
MVAWLRLFHFVPASTPAHGAALATVILATLSVVALERACLAWGSSVWAASIVATVYALSPIAWRLATQAEVFAMNALFAATILTLAGPRPPLAHAKRAIALALIGGIAIGDHLSIVMLAPVGLYGAWRAVRDSSDAPRVAMLAVATFALSLIAPYAYELHVARTADPLACPLWIEEPSLRGVWFHLRRGAYGSLALAGSGAAREPLQHILELSKRLVLDTMGLPILAVAILFRAPRAGTDERLGRASRLALGASLLLAGPGLVALFDLPLHSIERQVVERFYLLPELMICVPGALALDAVARVLSRHRFVAVALGAFFVIGQLVSNAMRRGDRPGPSVEQYVENTLRNAPPNAIVVGTGDMRWGGFLYARYALHLRPDVTFVNPSLLSQRWYRRLASELTGVNFETPTGKPIGPKTTVSRLLASGRPIGYTDWPDPKVADTPSYAVGTLMRVVAPGEAPPSSERLEAMNLEAFAAFTLEPAPPPESDAWGHALAPDYARPWIQLARRFDAEGRPDDAQRCLARAGKLAPWTVRMVAREAWTVDPVE